MQMGQQGCQAPETTQSNPIQALHTKFLFEKIPYCEREQELRNNTAVFAGMKKHFLNF